MVAEAREPEAVDMIAPKIQPRACVQCGMVFKPHDSTRKGECCSVRCHVEHKIRKHGQCANGLSYGVGLHSRVSWCMACGTYMPGVRRMRCGECNKAKNRARYHARKMRRIWDTAWCRCVVCGKAWWAFDRASHRKYCSRKCASTIEKTYNHRKRARKYGVAYEKIKLQELAERDGGRCQICGYKVKRGRRFTKRRATIGHIVAMSRGGSHTWDNVQLECVMCNSSKGTATGGQRRLWGHPTPIGGHVPRS